MTAPARLALVPTLTPDYRARGLLRLAELHDDPELAKVIPAIVVGLSDRRCDVDAWWDELLTATRERSRFIADPRGYADLLGERHDERSLDRIEQRLCGEVDAALSQLVGTQVRGMTA